MRLAILTHRGDRIGGTEAYLETIVPELVARGVAIKLIFERSVGNNTACLEFPTEVETQIATGSESDLAQLRRWQPDVIFNHGLLSADWEEQVVDSFRVVHFAHNYYGTCISGNKSVGWSRPTPCLRRFGHSCLGNYYPLRCGGLSPITMFKDFSTQSHRLSNLKRCGAIVTASSHMRNDYVSNGLSETQVHCVPLPVRLASDAMGVPPFVPPYRVLFAGRMVKSKGGDLLIDALSLVADKLQSAIHLTLVGDGPERSCWEARAAAVQTNDPRLATDFLPWASSGHLLDIYSRSHLIVIPSTWPEPFGLVGLEAAARGIPAAAFAVGGIPDWLREGVNGHLASAHTHSSSSLAEAIALSLSDPDHYARLSEGACEIAAEFSMDRHVTSLLSIFQAVIGASKVSSGATRKRADRTSFASIVT